MAWCQATSHNLTQYWPISAITRPQWVNTFWGFCYIGYPSGTQFSREISFAHNSRFSCPIVLKFCREIKLWTQQLWPPMACWYFQTDFQNNICIFHWILIIFTINVRLASQHLFRSWLFGAKHATSIACTKYDEDHRRISALLQDNALTGNI